MQTVKISSKNQITLSRNLLDFIGAQRGDRLLVEVEGEKIVARPIQTSITDQVSGALKVKPSLRGLPFEKVLEETKRIVARELK